MNCMGIDRILARVLAKQLHSHQLCINQFDPQSILKRADESAWKLMRVVG